MLGGGRDTDGNVLAISGLGWYGSSPAFSFSSPSSRGCTGEGAPCPRVTWLCRAQQWAFQTGADVQCWISKWGTSLLPKYLLVAYGLVSFSVWPSQRSALKDKNTSWCKIRTNLNLIVKKKKKERERIPEEVKCYFCLSEIVSFWFSYILHSSGCRQ